MPHSSSLLPPRQLGRLLMEIAHPNIEEVSSVSMTEVVTVPVEGMSLSRALLNDETKQQLILEAARALAHVHTMGWSHGNIDKNTIVIGRSNQPVLTDFRFAHHIDSPASETATADVAALVAAFRATSRPVDALRARAGRASDQADNLSRILSDCSERSMTADQLIAVLQTKSKPKTRPEPRRRYPKVSVMGLVALPLICIALAANARNSLQSEPVVPAQATPTAAAEPMRISSNNSLFEVDVAKGDKIEIGNFDCGPESAVLLRKADRSLWKFETLPQPGQQTAAQRVTSPERALDIWTEPSSGCDRVGVLNPNGSIGRIQVTK